ncbi:MAG: hypothetical protein ACK4RX_05465 [Chitinophagaceae bacterium]
MKRKKQNEHILKWTVTFILVFLLFAGCRKYDILSPDTSQNYEELKSKFFNTTSTSDSEIKKLAENVKKQDSIFKFLPDFVRKNGLPKWDKVVYKTSSKSNLAKRQNSSTSTNSATSTTNTSSSSYDGEQGVFLIPLQSQNSQEIKSYITAYKHNDSLYTYRLYNKDSLNSIQPGSITTKNNLLNAQAVFGYFEKSINNVDSVNITSPLNATIKNVTIDFLTEPSLYSTARTEMMSSNSSSGCIMSIYIHVEYALEIWSDGTAIESISVTMVITIDCSGGGGGGGCGCGGSTGGGSTGGSSTGSGSTGGGSSGSGGYWWNYGSGWPWYTGGGGGGYYDPNWYWWWTGGGFGGGSGFSPTVTALSNQLGLSYAQSLWLETNPQRTLEINNFINNTIYSDLTFSDKVELALTHLNNMMSDSDYLEMVDAYSASMSFGHPWMVELFKELATEIGLKVIKKYIPGYGDWQSIKDAIDNAGHGDLLGALGEVLNIVKKKVPWLAAVDAVIDVFDFEKLAKKAWKAFDKIKDLPTPAFNGLLKTIKDKCGDILGKIEHDNNIQGLIKYNPNDAENFFRDIANNVGVGVSSTSTPGVFYFDIGNPPNNIRFNYYPVSRSGQEPSIEIIFPSGYTYKFRFRL